MKKQRVRARGWRLSAATACLALSTTVSAVAAKDLVGGQIRGEGDKDLTLTVRVYNYGGVSAGDLATAERVAARIFQKAGLQLSWVDCPGSREEIQRIPVCLAPHAPAEIILNVVAELVAGPRVGEAAMGLALATPAPNRGYLANIAHGRATRLLLEAPRELTLGQLLGHGIAHEIGHLLLGSHSHSPSGLMSARWKSQELMLAAYGQFNFSPEQAATLRSDVQARLDQREAELSEAVAAQR